MYYCTTRIIFHKRSNEWKSSFENCYSIALSSLSDWLVSMYSRLSLFRLSEVRRIKWDIRHRMLIFPNPNPPLHNLHPVPYMPLDPVRPSRYTSRLVWYGLLARSQNSPWNVATSLFRILVGSGCPKPDFNVDGYDVLGVVWQIKLSIMTSH